MPNRDILKLNMGLIFQTAITGQFDMIKVGPNRLLAVGNDSEGTKGWPATE